MTSQDPPSEAEVLGLPDPSEAEAGASGRGAGVRQMAELLHIPEQSPILLEYVEEDEREYT